MKRKILLSFVAILMVSVLIIGLLSINLVKQSYTTELERRLVTNAGLIAAFIGTDGIRPEDPAFSKLADELADQGQVRMTLMDHHGRVIYDSRADWGLMELHHQRPEVISALRDGIGKEIRYSNTTGQEMMYVAVPVFMSESDGIAYVVRLAMDLQEIDALTKHIVWYLTISLAFGLLIAVVLGFRLIDRIIENIRGIVNMTQRMADGNYDKHIYLESNDELSELADHFNHMADRLNETIGKLSESNARFMALLTSLKNPMIALDQQKCITLMNAASENLFGVTASELQGHHLLELVRDTELDDVIQDVLENQLDQQVEVTLREPAEKTLRMMTSLIREPEDPLKVTGLVILMDDVTEIRKLEKMRSDFVTNVTHELKTPLTSISGFVETLKSGEIEDDETRQRFLDIIEIETERLTRLINDILTLSEIENIRGHERKVPAAPGELLEEVISMMETISRHKAVTLHREIARNLSEMPLNEDRFKQMVINLIDNAIKYTPEGGKVTVSAYEKYRSLVIRVKDTGIGIPDKDLHRLFERFYRVDKARSKKMGGTGLGLAIVKHIVLSMNGTIRVNSEVGKGTEFVITLPLA
ncbi:two-component system histidine kinase PnpS [Anoxynatronum buryatiense]|uniref:histidine kinase n=1 Tax=Anoxynatronum buryatiense TaxID=489973 RepID=A0AA45WWU6_9CLOT|nr:ATP-binding protein [Anoxynatronum buryatiense]SMP61275.1 PAS/PAC sensor signal transduction histidine kinase [Anoxynatronum buryatiense]